MLLIYGVTAFIAGVVLNAAGLALAKNAQPTSFRRLLGGQTVDSIAVTLVFGGSLTMMIFLAEYQTQAAVPLQIIAAVALAAAGYFGVRLIRRLAGPTPAATIPASAEPLDIALPAGPSDPAPADDHHKRAA